jgi:hypothetical protein
MPKKPQPSDVFAGASRAKKSYTQKHKPLLWENMLGTVYAVNPDREVKYFDYDWAAAHEYIQLDKYTDLRVCKCKHSWAEWPRIGKWALFGILKEG